MCSILSSISVTASIFIISGKLHRNWTFNIDFTTWISFVYNWELITLSYEMCLHVILSAFFGFGGEIWHNRWFDLPNESCVLTSQWDKSSNRFYSIYNKKEISLKNIKTIFRLIKSSLNCCRFCRVDQTRISNSLQFKWCIYTIEWNLWLTDL